MGGVSSQEARGAASCFRKWLRVALLLARSASSSQTGTAPFARDLMRALTVEERFDIVGCARDGREAVELATSLLPDVVLMGMEMPTLDAIEATRRIRARVPSARVFLMGPSEQLEDVDLALAAGAAGVVRRSCASADVVATMFGLAVVFTFDPSALAEGRAEPPVSR